MPQAPDPTVGGGRSVTPPHRSLSPGSALGDPEPRRQPTMRLELYDTTLRDGAQMEGISLSVEDKLKIARKLDEVGVHYIEGGWPGSNPQDAEFFATGGGLPLRNARNA